MAEHVSFVTIKAAPGKRDAVVEHFRKWDDDQKPHAKGFVRAVIASGKDDSDTIMGAVVWDNSENYYANGSRPEQDAWFRELLTMLEGEPQWFDANVMHESSG